ncbi:MocR-like ectoine utilization transcription factor EhuR [Sinorhizobium arboris]|uniref:MocR-like ectoine utilization transcription factor EhuR n=1 Tax=Sinorhizobium arboris TaxID=76745 RepID=UPI000418838A|nr:PLP-dependent aminotransferase family protein [Sinorhizobium arboris]
MSFWLPSIPKSSFPRYAAIADAIEEAINQKRLHPGQQLPTHRELAQKLGFSVQTVARAYAEAERRGLTAGEVGRGTFVQYVTPDVGQGFVAETKQSGVTDFSNITPLRDDIHVQAFKNALANMMTGAPLQRAMEYRPSQGLVQHRLAAVGWLQRHGISVDVENVVITNGATHGIWTAMATLLEPGDVIGTEALTQTANLINASVMKLRLRGIPVDAQGIIPEAVEEAYKRQPIKVLSLTPCYNNPTGSLMGDKRRVEIAEIARKYDIAIIENDVFGPLIPNRPKPLWTYAPERTYYVTSFSKAVMPTLRTGFLCGPPGMTSRLISRLRGTGYMSNTWTAEILAAWIFDGTVERLIEWQRDQLSERCRLLKKTLSAYKVVAHPYALHAWLTLPEPWRSQTFFDQARSRRLLVTPPDPFIVGRGEDPHAVRLAVGDTVRDKQDFVGGLKRVAALLAESPEPPPQAFQELA